MNCAIKPIMKLHNKENKKFLNVYTYLNRLETVANVWKIVRNG